MFQLINAKLLQLPIVNNEVDAKALCEKYDALYKQPDYMELPIGLKNFRRNWRQDAKDSHHTETIPFLSGFGVASLVGSGDSDVATSVASVNSDESS